MGRRGGGLQEREGVNRCEKKTGWEEQEGSESIHTRMGMGMSQIKFDFEKDITLALLPTVHVMSS